jgi:hypothetical protein
MGSLRPGAGESCNISHGHIGEVKEILKKLGDDPFGMRRMDSWQGWVMEGGALRRLLLRTNTGGIPVGSRSSPLHDQR